MDSKAEMFVRRARTEIDSATILFESSSDKSRIKEDLKIDQDSTFYSGVISHAYYSIFYCAKAMLLTKGVETSDPFVHSKTYNAFKEIFIDTGVLDTSLLMIYKELIIRADVLLEIFKEEKRKRGDFTYNTIPQANRSPAETSIKNAKTFFRHCNSYISRA
jgi:uncharacterized protein (UPF0332 family)